MKKDKLDIILKEHKKWLMKGEKGKKANLQNADLRDTNLQNVDLQNADLQYADLRDVDLRDTNLQDANLQNADLRNANLQDADLYNADLQNADLRDTNLQNADLQNADLQYVDLQNANLQNANLQNADLQNADLQYADLRDADLRNANLQYADLQNADLQNANLQDANLQNADLRDTNLQYADLQNADLQNANLQNANLQNADLRNANLRNAAFAKLHLGEYACDIWSNKIRVGCQLQSVRWWENLTEAQAEKIALNGGSWLKMYKDVILLVAKNLGKGHEIQRKFQDDFSIKLDERNIIKSKKDLKIMPINSQGDKKVKNKKDCDWRDKPDRPWIKGEQDYGVLTLRYEHKDKIVQAEISGESTIEEVTTVFKGILVAASYSTELVENNFPGVI